MNTDEHGCVLRRTVKPRFGALYRSRRVRGGGSKSKNSEENRPATTGAAVELRCRTAALGAIIENPCSSVFICGSARRVLDNLDYSSCTRVSTDRLRTQDARIES
jgi:hypothetical protein